MLKEAKEKKMSVWASGCQLWAEAARRESITRTLGMSSYLNKYYAEIQKKVYRGTWVYCRQSQCVVLYSLLRLCWTHQAVLAQPWVDLELRLWCHLSPPKFSFFPTVCICHVCDWTPRDWSLKCYADAGPTAYFNSFSF